jgi:DNA-binding CsgD family transcriptional regulator
MREQKILTIQQFSQGFEKSVARVRQLSKNFCEPLDITLFGYVRVYHNGCVSWVTSNPDQDRFLIESGVLNEEPLLNTPKALKEGHYLWFNDRQFQGCESFYRDRARLFRLDHGMVVVRHQKNYLETCCFSGLLAKRPLYNLFMNEKALFSTFMEYFVKQLDIRLLALLEEGVTIADLKREFGQPEDREIPSVHRNSLIAACGWKNLLQLSKREKECLALLKQGYTYQSIGACLGLSARTVEHYIDSIKNKLGLEMRSELYLAAEKLLQLGLLS